MDSRTKKIISLLNKLYPKPRPFLNFRTPFESLIATILSAQCTDERVNKVTPALFRIANTPEKILALGEKKLMSCIKSTGFYRAKTHSILGASKAIMEKFGGRVPSSLIELQQLPGVGRKTASVILAQAFKIPAFPVDRHVFRVANRLALGRATARLSKLMRPKGATIANAKDADKTSEELEKNIPKNYWIPLHLQLVSHGRKICRPNPKCAECKLLQYCPEGKKRKKNHGAHASGLSTSNT